jgi:cytosine/adenosine deaminase-related metal-dependent hydrolase
MVKSLALLFISLFCLVSHAQDLLVLEGDIPGQYIDPIKKNQYIHGAVVIHLSGSEEGLIKDLVVNPKELEILANNPQVRYLKLQRQGQWDVIYPGLIDLHNHTKQNNLGVWEHAHGQFANRFEWRAWSNYKKSVSNNMNPWIGYGKAVTCAAFRWSEMQAMVVGTTYLQGPSSCVTDFAIHQVESLEAYRTGKDKVKAPTDLVIPNDMVYVWETLAKDIRVIQAQHPEDSEEYKLAYEEALAKNINHHCDFASQGVTTPIDKFSVRSNEGLDILKNKKLLEASCTKNLPLPTKFIRYVYWVHKSINSKKLYADKIENGDGSAIIAHLAEGRRDDYYNQKEFELVQLLGMDRPHVNFVHGVGITDDGLRVMARKNMGLIWSPFSNLLLYNQTLDVAKALEIGVNVALGSDWLPTGSKGPLEELKVAREYLQTTNIAPALTQMPGADSLDEALFKMVTENPAKMINQWQAGGIGTLAPNRMGSVIVTSKLDSNPYTNLVAKVWETDINLVVIDGRAQYGNSEYLDQLGKDFEKMPNGEFEFERLHQQPIPVLEQLVSKPDKQQKEDFLELLGKLVTKYSSQLVGQLHCQFSGPKGFVLQSTLNDYSELKEFKNESGINLDRFADIQRLLGINLMTQSRNRNDKDKGDPDFQVKDFTPLYTCNDSRHMRRINDFIKYTWQADTFLRQKRIKEQGHGKVPEKLAEKYKAP